MEESKISSCRGDIDKKVSENDVVFPDFTGSRLNANLRSRRKVEQTDLTTEGSRRQLFEGIDRLAGILVKEQNPEKSEEQLAISSNTTNTIINKYRITIENSSVHCADTIIKQEDDCGTGDLDCKRSKIGNAESRKQKALIDKTETWMNEITSHNKLVKTRAYREIKDTLYHQGVVVIKGKPGDGKTFTALHVMRDFVNGAAVDGIKKRPIQLFKPSDWDTLVNKGENLVILLDDLFGSYCISISSVTEWLQRLPQMQYSLSMSDYSISNYLIITIRNEVFESCPPVIKDNAIFQQTSVVDFSSDLFKYNSEEKREILCLYTQWINPQWTEEEIKLICANSPSIGFPQCCRLFNDDKKLRSKRVKFFESPIAYLSKQVKNLQTFDRMKYCALVLAMLLGGNLTVEIDISKMKILQEVFECCGVDQNRRSVNNVIDAASCLVGTYFNYSQVQRCFTFCHESIQDTLVFEFGKRYPSKVITFGDIKLLRYICSLETKHDDMSEHCIVITSCHFRALVLKLIELIQTQESQNLQAVSELHILKDKNFRKDFLKSLDNESALEICDENNHSLIVHVVKCRNYILAEELLMQEISVNQKYLALNVACSLGNLNITKLLLSKGATPDINSCFHALECVNLPLEILELLMQYDVDVFQTCSSKMVKYFKMKYHMYDLELLRTEEVTLLKEASMVADFKQVKILLELKPHILNLNVRELCCLLQYAALGGNLDIVTMIIEKMESIEESKQSFVRHLFDIVRHAVLGTERKDVDNVESILLSFEEESVLHISCLCGNLEIVRYLFANFPKLHEKQNISGQSAIFYAANGGDVELIEFLSKKSLDIFQRDINNCTILHIACGNGNIGIAEYIVKNFPDLLSVQDRFGQTALFYACYSGVVALAKFLISQGLDIRQRDINMCTLLHEACSNGKLNMAKYLVEECPALLHMEDEWGQTALFYAAFSGVTDLADFLIKKGLDIRHQDHDKKTVLHVAAKYGKLHTAEYFEQICPALCDVIDINGQKPKLLK